MTRFLSLLISSLVGVSALAETPSNGLRDATVLIVRHAEKPEEGNGLTAAGQKRAEAYVKYFQGLPIDGHAFTPDCIIAGADSRNSIRPRLTLEPLARAMNVKMDTTHSTKDGGGKELADFLRAQPRGKSILICWRHGDIPELLTSLGAKAETYVPKAKWPDDVFCWLIVLHFDANGALIASDSKRINEQLMPGDAARN